MIERRIEMLLSEKFQEEEFQDCFLVELVSNPGRGLDVYLDSDSGITFTTCRRISRYLEAIIEEEQLLGEKYVLNVSSPGIGRPLLFVRQYKKNIGRKVEVTLIGGGKEVGYLLDVNDESIFIEFKERIKEGKKKRTIVVNLEIPFDHIKKTSVKVTF